MLNVLVNQQGCAQHSVQAQQLASAQPAESVQQPSWAEIVTPVPPAVQVPVQPKRVNVNSLPDKHDVNRVTYYINRKKESDQQQTLNFHKRTLKTSQFLADI